MYECYTIMIIDCKYDMYVTNTSIIGIELHISKCLLMIW